MTSKISYNKYIQKNLIERSYLIAVSVILQAVLLPLYTFIRLQRMSEYPTTDMIDMIGIHFKGIASGSGSLGFLFFLGLFAIIAAITGFSYLHSKEKQDFYIGLPVKKTQWYLINYISGLIIFLIPYIILSLSSVIIGKLYANISMDIIKESLIHILLIIIIYMIIYHITILAMTLTGNLVTAILAGGVIAVYGLLITFINNGLASTFYETWTYQSSSVYDNLLTYTSPAGLITMIAGNIPSRENLPKTIIAIVLMLSVTFALSYVLCKHYPSESAGNSLSYNKTASIIKAFIAIPVSIGITLLGTSIIFGSNPSFAWWIVTSVIVTLLVCFIIEFIYTHDIRMLLKRKGITILSLSIVLITIVIYKFDLTGYDKWIPKENKIEAVYIENNQVSNYFRYYDMPFGYYDNFTFKGTKSSNPENISAVTELVKEGISYLDNYDSEKLRYQVTVKYDMKNGTSKYRTYSVPKETLINTYDTLIKDEEFNNSLRPLLSMDTDMITGISLEEIPNKPSPTISDKETLALFLDTFKQEYGEKTLEELSNEKPIAAIEINYNYYNDSIFTKPDAAYNSVITIPIYSSYTETISLLKDIGLNPEVALDFSKINYINKFNDYKMVSVTDSKEKEELLERVAFFGDYILFYDEMLEPETYVEILFEGENGYNTYNLYKK